MLFRRRLDWIALLIVAIAVAMPLLVARLAMPTPAPTTNVATTPPPATAPILAATRELKLLTVALESTVTTTKTDDSWRGNASATIKVPVKYHFGVDLSNIDDHHLFYNPLTQTQTLTIPPPSLLAIEIDGGHPITERIDVTGLRFKKLSGAEQLNLAQKSLYDAARKQTLPQKDMDQVRLATRTQIEGALARIVASSAHLRVKFTDE